MVPRWGWAAVGAGLVSVVVGANVWLRVVSAGHRFSVVDVPLAPVVIVPGAKVGVDGEPLAYLRGRLDVAIELLQVGKVREILISGDAAGVSGDEIASMRGYLLARGVDAGVVREDGLGVTTRATCERARWEFGVGRAIIVSQRGHTARAVALCRGVGIDADGVEAGADCRRRTLVRNRIRELLAAPKAVGALVVMARR